ncbi:MAG: hypothetical protein AAB152_05980 [Candidatus Coatesbacteria bacterium]
MIRSKSMAATVSVAVIASIAVLACAWQADVAARAAWRAGFVRQAEELGGFVTRALASRSDLLVVERFGELVRHDDVTYVLVLDPAGRARFHGDAVEVGKTFDSPFAKAALAATATLVQDIPAAGVVEVDVPVGGGAVLRLGGAPRPLAASLRWLWTSAAVAAIALGALAIMASLAARPPG